MRSIALVSAAALFVQLVACTGGDGSTPTASQNLPSTNDDGGGKKPIGIPGDSVEPTPTTPPPANDDDVMPDPTPDTVPTCKGAALCVNECPEDDTTCYEACMKDMPAEESQKFDALGSCIDASGCETDECVQSVCASEINTCLGE